MSKCMWIERFSARGVRYTWPKQRILTLQKKLEYLICRRQRPHLKSFFTSWDTSRSVKFTFKIQYPMHMDPRTGLLYFNSSGNSRPFLLLDCFRSQFLGTYVKIGIPTEQIKTFTLYLSYLDRDRGRERSH